MWIYTLALRHVQFVKNKTACCSLVIIPFLGYYEFLTHRNVMVDMPTHHDPLEKVPLDGVVSVVRKTG